MRSSKVGLAVNGHALCIWTLVTCKAPRAFKDKAAALLILGDTNEYLYWNFTANARRGTLLYALDARSPGYATDLGIVELSQKRPQGSFLL